MRLPRLRRSFAGMSDANETTAGSPDGSTNLTDDQEEHTDDLGDGSATGTATEDPDQDTDVSSGGDPEG